MSIAKNGTCLPRTSGARHGTFLTALIEADVNVGVVRSVLASIREQAIGAEVSKALDPAQQVVKIVHAELIGLLGGETLKITQVRVGH